MRACIGPDEPRYLMNYHTYQRSARNSRSRRTGFTLLEVVIALGLVGMLVGMIFRVASTSVQLSQMVVSGQNETMERNAFFNLLRHHFEKIPGNAVVQLESNNSSSGGVSRNLFTLTFQNVPMSFNWGEIPMTAEAVQLASIEQRDGFIDVVLRFYDGKILPDDDDPFLDSDIEPVAEIILIEDLWMCDCEVVDGNTMEQFAEWDNRGKLPLQVKFYCRFEPSSDIVQQSFWIVPKQNPEVFFRQVMQQNAVVPGVAPGASEGTDQEPETNNTTEQNQETSPAEVRGEPDSARTQAR